MLQSPNLTRTFLIAALLAAACGFPLLASGAGAGQAPPRHGSGEPRPPEPRVRLEGHVQEFDSSSAKVAGATLEFIKGPNTGRTTVSDANGFFSFSDLAPSSGGQTVRISHPGYRTNEFQPSVWSHRPVNPFNPRLMPLNWRPKPVTVPPAAASTATDTFRGSISSSQTVCDMPDQDYPCQKFRLPYASGKTSLSAELTWTASVIDLDLIVYDGNKAIARSVSGGTKKDVLNARLSGSGPFDVRVISTSGKGFASFTLEVKRTN